jgi:hypothetical protein
MSDLLQLARGALEALIPAARQDAVLQLFRMVQAVEAERDALKAKLEAMTNATVFVVDIIGVYESDMLGIFGSLAKANEAIDAACTRFSSYHRSDFSISEITIDEARP